MSTPHYWCPGPVFITGGGKKKDVITADDDTRSDDMIEHAHRNIRSDIMSIFCWDSVPPGAPGLDFPSFYFSPKIYKPTKEGWFKLSDDIIKLFLDNGHTQLIRQSTPGTKTASKKSGEFRYSLICRRGRIHQKNTTDGQKNNQRESQTLPNGTTIDYKREIRLDPFSNKQRGIRGNFKNEGKSLPRRGRTEYATENCNKCSFVIPIYLKEGKHWRIPHRQKDTKYHNHLLLEKKEMTVPTDRLSDDTCKVCALGMKHAGSGAAKNMVADLSDVTITGNQAFYLRDKESGVSTTTKRKSPATELMEHLRGDKNLIYKALYHHTTVSSLLAMEKAKQRQMRIIIHKQKKKKSDGNNEAAGKENNTEGESDSSDDDDYYDTDDEDYDSDDSDIVIPVPPALRSHNTAGGYWATPTGARKKRGPNNKFSRDNDLLEELNNEPVILEAETLDEGGTTTNNEVMQLEKNSDKMELGTVLAKISKHKKLKVGQKILVCVGWCRKGEKRMFEMFPSVLMFDVTFKTNNEKRPLGVFAGIDQNMDVFTPMRVFMPSECQWVFSWIIGVAMISLLEREPLSRTKFFLTDGDSKIYRSYDQHKSTVMPKSDHGLCDYHLVNKGLENLIPKLLGWDHDVVKSQISTFKYWIFTWMSINGGVENDESFYISNHYLREWLLEQSNSTDKNIAHNAGVLEVFLVRLYYHKKRWFFPYRKHLMTLGHNTTSPLEGGVNGAMKRKYSKVVLPSMSLKTSMMTQDAQSQSKMNAYHRDTLSTHLSTPVWCNTPTKTQ